MRGKKILVSLISIFLGLLAGALLITATGNDPIEGFSFLIKGSTQTTKRIGDTLATATPLILTGLSVAFAFRTGLFNIGAAGQMLFGAFLASGIGLYVDLPTFLLVPLMIIVGALGGALVAFIPGLLKAKFNVHEVVSTIMMNWVSYWVVYYGVPSLLILNDQGVRTESQKLSAHATLQAPWLSNLFDGSYINYGIIIALIAVIVVSFILNKTTFGYELKAVGLNRDAAEYAGISVNKNIILSMMIAGALAGLAGVAQYAGNAQSIQIGILPTQGMDGIAVALLGANTPIGTLLAALFFGMLYAGRGFMSAMTSIPTEIADTIIAIIIYFSATSILIERLFDNLMKKRSARQNDTNSKEDM